MGTIKSDKDILVTTGPSPVAEYTIIGMVGAGGFTMGLAQKAMRIRAMKKGATAVIHVQTSTGLGGIRCDGTAIKY